MNQKKAIKRLFLLIAFLMLSAVIFANTAYTDLREITALEIAADMTPGINLFNTLDAHGDWASGLDTETMWGNPFTTLEMVTAMKQRGFKTLRIPVTWYKHMGPAPDYTIDKAWMDRVEEVANYAFANNMYVIINIHHDESWLVPTYTKQAAVTDQLVKVWTQIAIRFKDYSDYLIFETMNEPREKGSPHEWSSGTPENRDVINAFNLAAVNAIRAAGGNNVHRFIMIPQYAGGFTAASESLVIPNDDPKVLVSLHDYFPFDFTLKPIKDGGVDTWGTNGEIISLRNDLKRYYDTFISQGQAVILGEWGAGNKDNYAVRVKYYEMFANACKFYKIPTMVWIYEFDRRSLTWTYPLIEDAIFNAPADTLLPLPVIVHNVDTTIEAEDFNHMSGVQTQPSSEGGLNVGWIDANDWMEYCVDFPAPGNYAAELRVASPNTTGKVQIIVNGDIKANIDVPGTGDWQNWTTITTDSFGVSAGENTVRIRASGGGWNFNWLKVKTVGGSITPVTGVSVTPTMANITTSQTQQLTAVVNPANASDKSVLWSSDNTKVATVNETGLVTPISEGTATITVTTTDGSYVATCDITVTASGPGPGTIISLPFTHSGQGTYIWFTSQKPASVNSWNLTELTINGVDFTNKWSNNLPPADENNGWTIHYVGEYGWSTFEAK